MFLKLPIVAILCLQRDANAAPGQHLAPGCTAHLKQPLIIANHRATSRAVIAALPGPHVRYSDVSPPLRSTAAWTA
jgi:hypothetical protein